MRLLGLNLTNLTPRETQLHRVHDEKKSAAITPVMEKINDRSGEFIISRGSSSCSFLSMVKRLMLLRPGNK